VNGRMTKCWRRAGNQAWRGRRRGGRGGRAKGRASADGMNGAKEPSKAGEWRASGMADRHGVWW